VQELASQFRLDGKVALITGAGKGIGKCIALTYAQAGADVIVAELDKNAGESVCKSIKELGKKALYMPVDVTSVEQIKKMVETSVKEFKKIDILVNNVGGPKFGPTNAKSKTAAQENTSVITMTDEFWDWHIRFNLTSTFWCCREVGKIMAAQKSGNIVNISSVAGTRVVPGMAAYGTPKAAVNHLTQILALELSIYNIRVNAVTPMLILHSDQDWGLSPDPEEQKKRARSAGVVVGRVGKVEDIANMALFLAADASSYVTGEIIDVAGGPVFPADIMERFESRAAQSK
jgi:NAD(P)-dependent dehydrogenase (short-subunit alcohol dehydrogenase family)